MKRKVPTEQVRAGLNLIDAEMSATADTMDDRPDDQQAIRVALAWIIYEKTRVYRQRAKATTRSKT